MERRAGSSEGQAAGSWPEGPSFHSACGSSRPLGGCFDLPSSPLGDTSSPALSSGFPKDALLFSRKRACLNSSSSAVAKAQTSAHLLPSPHNLLEACFGGGTHPCSSPQGACLSGSVQGLWRRQLTLTKSRPLCSRCSLMSFSHQPWTDFYRGPS